MKDRENEGNKTLTPDTDKSGEEKTLQPRPKCQKVEFVPTKEKIKKEKKHPQN